MSRTDRLSHDEYFSLLTEVKDTLECEFYIRKLTFISL